MTQEDKNLLLQDLCCRLPYGVKGQVDIEASTGHYETYSGHLEFTEVGVDVELYGIQEEEITVSPIDDKYGDVISDYYYTFDEFTPYLRPMSSVTDEEKTAIAKIATYVNVINITKEMLEFCCSHHLDFHGLIEKGLAIEAPEDMYKS